MYCKTATFDITIWYKSRIEKFLFIQQSCSLIENNNTEQPNN